MPSTQMIINPNPNEKNSQYWRLLTIQMLIYFFISNPSPKKYNLIFPVNKRQVQFQQIYPNLIMIIMLVMIQNEKHISNIYQAAFEL